MAVQVLTREEIENVRHYALKVQLLVDEIGWCSQTAAIINLECNENFTRGLSKTLKGFARKRQV